MILNEGRGRMKKKNYLNFSKKKMLAGTLSIIMIITILGALYINAQAYEVKVNNKVIGLTKDKDSIDQVMSSMKASYKEQYNKEVEFSQDVSFNKVMAFGEKTESSTEIMSEIEKNIDVEVEAYAITVNDEDLAIVSDEKIAEKILDEHKQTYVEQLQDESDIDIKEIGFVENVEIQKKYVDPDSIIDEEETYNLITTGTKEIKKYKVQKGETATHVAVKYHIYLDDLRKANPGVNLELLQIGQTLNVSVPKPLISVKIVEGLEYEEAIPFEVEYEDEDNLYIGDRKTKVQGVNGEKEVKAEAIMINGIEEERKIVDEKVVKEPKTSVVLVGTTPRPKTLAYGEFRDPTRGLGRISSPFGSRWGSTHTGVDIANPIGTTITAADGGKVVFAGVMGTYGKLVIIDHENGYQTYYAHCSAFLVKKGERVYRGEAIARVGNTGRSTGPHVHFEVRKNGTPVNPLSYINR